MTLKKKDVHIINNFKFEFIFELLHASSYYNFLSKIQKL